MVKQLKGSELRNQIIINSMIELKNQIIELEKQKEEQFQTLLKVDEENGHNGRLKVIREEQHKLNHINWRISKRREELVDLFLNYKEQ